MISTLLLENLDDTRKRIETLEAELAALKEVWPCEVCGKPDVDNGCVWIDTPTDEDPTHETLICGGCASKRERLIEAAAFRKAAKHQRIEVILADDDPTWLVSKGGCSCGSLVADGITPFAELWQKHIESLASPDALLALDAYVQSKLAEARKEWEAGRARNAT